MNFIICDDNVSFLNDMESTVFNFLMNYDVDYKIYKFCEYNEQFEKIVAANIGYKVYLLDIETKNSSGLDAARMIREQYDDWSSIIIIITSHEEFRYDALGARLGLLDFVNKLDNCKKFTKEALLKSMKIYDNRPKILKVTYYNVVSNIEYKDIIYIEKEQDSKRCIIKTTHNEKYFQGTLNELYKILNDKRFLKVHRSSIVNLDQIKEYNISESKIIFKNGTESYLVAREKKKELKEYVTNSN